MKTTYFRANRCAIRHMGGDVYVYLFSVYIKLGYPIVKPGGRYFSYPTACFIGDGVTGKILSYVISHGKPKIDLFDYGVMLLKDHYPPIPNRLRYSLFPRALSTDLSTGSNSLGINEPRPSLNPHILKKTSIIDQDELGYELLKYLYDWSLDDYFLGEETGIPLSSALRLIDSAVARFNYAKVG